MIADTSVDIDTSQSRHNTYRTASPTSSSRKETHARKDQKHDDQYNARGQRHQTRKPYGQPTPLLGYEYEDDIDNEDPLEESREIGAQQYALMTGEENHIEAPPRYMDDEGTTQSWDDDDDHDHQVAAPPRESKVKKQENRVKNRYSKRTTRKRNGPHEEVTTRIVGASPSRQESILERYPEYMLAQTPYGMLPDYGYEEHISQADDMSPSYFEDGHHDYDGDHRAAADHDYDDAHLPEDHSDHHSNDKHHYTNHHDHDNNEGHDKDGHQEAHHDGDEDGHDHEEGKDNETESTESHTLTLTGKDNIPSDMRVHYYHDEEGDPREREADAFLMQREREAEHMLLGFKAQEKR